MKFVEPNNFTDPDAAARKLLEIANAAEAGPGRLMNTPPAYPFIFPKVVWSARERHRLKRPLIHKGF